MRSEHVQSQVRWHCRRGGEKSQKRPRRRASTKRATAPSSHDRIVLFPASFLCRNDRFYPYKVRDRVNGASKINSPENRKQQLARMGCCFEDRPNWQNGERSCDGESETAGKQIINPTDGWLDVVPNETEQRAAEHVNNIEVGIKTKRKQNKISEAVIR